MPLDGTALRIQTITEELGITPVPKEVLMAHKLAELNRHPGGFLFRHRQWIDHLFSVTFLAGLISGFLAAIMVLVALVIEDMSLFTRGIAAVGVCLLLCASVIGMMLTVKVKEPAEWVEIIPDLLDGIPPQMLAMAIQIRDHLWDARLVVGRLTQNKVLLDPYLLVRNMSDGEEIVIGIWDGDEIIACAQRR